MKTFTAKRISRAGSTPVWEYRGYRIVKVLPDYIWGSGYVFEYVENCKVMRVHATKLARAKMYVDQIEEKGK